MSDLSLIYKFKRATDIEKSPDGKYYAVSSTYVMLLSSTSKLVLYKFNKFKYATTCVFSHDSKYLAIKSDFGKIILFSLDKMEVVKTFTTSQTEGPEIMFSPDDKFLITSDWNGKIFKIDLVNGLVINLKNYSGFLVRSARYDDEHGRFLFLVTHILTSGQTILNSTGQDLLVEWDYIKGDNAIKEHGIDGVLFRTIYNSARKIYFILRYNSFEILDENFEKESDIYQLGPKEFMQSADCSKDGRYLAVLLSAKSTLQIYEYSNQMNLVKKCIVDRIGIVKFITIEGIECLFLGAYDEGYLYNFEKFLEDPEFTNIHNI